MKAFQVGLFFLVKFESPHRLGSIEMGFHFFQQGDLALCVFIAAFGDTAHPIEALFYRFKIRKRQFGIYRVDVRSRVNCIGHVGDIFIFETAHHMGDGIAFPDVGEELVAKSFALGGPRHQTCNVGKFDRGGDKLFWFDQFSKFVQSRVGNRHDSRIGLDSAKRKVFGSNAGFSQGIEQS